MATIAAVNVVLDAKTGAFNRKMSTAQGTVKRMGSSIKNLRGLYKGVLVAGAIMATRATFQLASAVEETGSKFKTVFGESADAVDEFIDSFGVLAGLSDTQARGIISTTGAIAQGMGFAQDASAKFSAEIVTLAGDLASFNNLPIEQTARAIQSALTGEKEALKTLGISFTAAEVDARALAIAQREGAKAATMQHKALATVEIVTQRAGVAVGDLENTQDSAANKARALTAEIQNLKESLARTLLPVFAAGLRATQAMFNGIKLGFIQMKIDMAQYAVFWHKLPLLGDPESLNTAIENLASLKTEYQTFFQFVREQAARKIDMSMFEGIQTTDSTGETVVGRATREWNEMVAGLRTAYEEEQAFGRFMSQMNSRITDLGMVIDFSTHKIDDSGIAIGTLRTTLQPMPILFNQAAFEAQRAGLNIEFMGDKADKASSAFSKLSQAMRFLGGIANIFNLSGTITSFLSKAGSVLSMGDTLSDAGVFGSGKKAGLSNSKPARLMAEPPAPVVVNINGPGLETLVDTITVKQGRNRELRRVRRVRR